MNRLTVREYIELAMCFLEDMPEIDCEADVENLTPEDAGAHQAGLAYQELVKAMKELEKP